jgi:hypothetical protein
MKIIWEKNSTFHKIRLSVDLKILLKGGPMGFLELAV